MASRSIPDSPLGIPAEGLTILSVPETDASVDIVFVHGFTGHPYRTWLKQGAQVSGGAGEPPPKSLGNSICSQSLMIPIPCTGRPTSFPKQPRAQGS